MWRPVPAYGAFDLPTYTIDLTPFVPILADGKNHTVSLDVASDEYDHTLNPNWYLSGNLQVFRFTSTHEFQLKYEIGYPGLVHRADDRKHYIL